MREKFNIKNVNWKIFSGGFLTLFLLFATILTVSNINKPQDVRQRASEFTLPRQIPVLVLAFYPRDLTNQNMLDQKETNMQQSITSIQSHVDDMIQQNITFINDATRYHGYKDIGAPQYLNFYVLDKKEYFDKIPPGVKLGWSPYASRPNHGQILSNINICDYVDTKGVREVWMYGYHSNTIEPDESRMSSKYGDISNSLPHDESVPQQFRMPLCNHSYTFYNYNYSRGTETEIHDRLHQVENMMAFLEGPGHWPPSQNPDNITGSMFWGNFSIYVQNNTQPPSQTGCGNAHYPPNWKNAATDSYQYTLPTTVSSNCGNWPNNQYAIISSLAWGNSELGYYKWWLQNMPGYANGIMYQGQHMRNWWDAFYDFDGFVQQGRTLFCNSEATCHFPFTQNATQPSPTTKPQSTQTGTSTQQQVFPSATPFNSQVLQQQNFQQNTNPQIQQTPINIWPSIIFNGINTAAGSTTIPSGRSVTICLYSQQINVQQDLGCNTAKVKQTIQLEFDNASRTYKVSPNFSIGIVSPGTYYIVISSPKYARKMLNQPVTISLSTTEITIPQTTLIAGDINGDGILNIVDYSLLTSCTGTKILSSQCVPYKDNLDLNEDGVVDLIDLNVFQRNLKLQSSGNY